MSLKEKFLPLLGRVFGRNSFAQAGEDAVLSFLWNSKNIDIPTYLEIGVCDPRNGNNTYLYHLKGGSGVLVEADLSQIKGIKEKRPNDRVIHAGISSISNLLEADFYVFDIPAVNTFDPAEAEIRKIEGRKLLRIDKVPLHSINVIIEQNFETYPQFLSIDIEGLDYDVLKDWDHQSFPIPVICVETCKYSETLIKEKDERFQKLMLVKGYFIYADTYINTIFVNKEWFYKLK